MFEDLADLFEQAAADATPIREIVGEDPVEFVRGLRPELLAGWLHHDRARKELTDAIERAETEGLGREESR